MSFPPTRELGIIDLEAIVDYCFLVCRGLGRPPSHRHAPSQEFQG